MSGVVLAGFVIGAAVMGVVALIASAKRADRDREMPAVAAKAGLAYSSVDRFNCTGVPFPLFRAGDGRQVTNVMWREQDDDTSTPVRVFDYTYYVETESRNDNIPNLAFNLLTDDGLETTSSQQRNRTYHRYTC